MVVRYDRECAVPGVLREPRSVWSFGTIDRATTSILRLVFDREHFRNGSRWPITLERLAVSPLGYRYIVDNGAVTPVADGTYANVFLASKIRISVPGRQHYMRKPVHLSSFPLLNTFGPNTDVTGDLGSEDAFFGVYHKKFDFPVLLPTRGTIAMDLTAVQGALGANAGLFSIGFQQLSDNRYGGEGRISEPVTVQTIGLGATDGGLLIPPFNPGGEFIAGVATTGNPWPPQMRFSTRAFDQQQSSRGATARTPVTGLSVFSTNPLFLTWMIGSRVRIVDGDSHGEYWWRPGAPLALVCDTVTPAIVYELPTPITLEPGDALDVELEVRSDVVGSPPQTPSYQVGVSFNGYCEIEG